MKSMIYRSWKVIIVSMLIVVLASPLFSIAGVDGDLKKNWAITIVSTHGRIISQPLSFTFR
jgi:hypothetical protein